MLLANRTRPAFDLKPQLHFSFYGGRSGIGIRCETLAQPGQGLSYWSAWSCSRAPGLGGRTALRDRRKRPFFSGPSLLSELHLGQILPRIYQNGIRCLGGFKLAAEKSSRGPKAPPLGALGVFDTGSPSAPLGNLPVGVRVR